MMRKFVKPRIVVSKCIEFEHCRYNAQIIRSEIVQRLKPHVVFFPVCPEVEIGLGVPRDSIRIVCNKKIYTLIQPNTGKDITDEMNAFTYSFLKSLRDIDGFILKARSPSCGIKDVKVYPNIGKTSSISKTAGFFGVQVLKHFSHLAIEDEIRLRNSRIREHFLTQLFALAHFRSIKPLKSIKELIRFHSENKLLLMSYNQKKLKELGRIIANHEKKPFNEIINSYGHHFSIALSKAPRLPSNTNILMHAMGSIKKNISSKEKAFFIEIIKNYRNGNIALSVPVQLMKSWIIRFEEHHLMEQTFFQPYPQDLMEDVETVNIGKMRDFWK